MAYKKGSWNVVCDTCGFEFKSDQMRQRWDGRLVCPKDWELRNPLDFLRVPKEDVSVPFSRPEHDLSGYIVCTLTNSQAIAGVAVAGCARAGSVTF